MRPYSRPPIGWLATIGVFAWYGFVAVVGAGIFTALLVAALRPPAAVWIPAWIVLALALGALNLHHDAPQWFAWVRGRDPRRLRPGDRPAGRGDIDAGD